MRRTFFFLLVLLLGLYTCYGQVLQGGPVPAQGGGGSVDPSGNYTWTGTNVFGGYTVISNAYIYELFITNGNTNIMTGYLADWYGINPTFTNNFLYKNDASNTFQLISGMGIYYNTNQITTYLNNKADKTTVFSGVGTTGLVYSTEGLNDTKFLRGDGQWVYIEGGTNSGSGGTLADGSDAMWLEKIEYVPTSTSSTNTAATQVTNFIYGAHYNAKYYNLSKLVFGGSASTVYPNTGYLIRSTGTYEIEVSRNFITQSNGTHYLQCFYGAMATPLPSASGHVVYTNMSTIITNQSYFGFGEDANSQSSSRTYASMGSNQQCFLTLKMYAYLTNGMIVGFRQISSGSAGIAINSYQTVSTVNGVPAGWIKIQKVSNYRIKDYED